MSHRIATGSPQGVPAWTVVLLLFGVSAAADPGSSPAGTGGQRIGGEAAPAALLVRFQEGATDALVERVLAPDS